MEILEQEVPLRLDENGVVRVGDTRVLFALLIRSYRQGHTPEELVQQYSTLSLADAYGAIAYYLQHQDQVEEYLQRREEEADRVRQKLKEAGVAVEVEVSETQEESS